MLFLNTKKRDDQSYSFELVGRESQRERERENLQSFPMCGVLQRRKGRKKMQE